MTFYNYYTCLCCSLNCETGYNCSAKKYINVCFTCLNERLDIGTGEEDHQIKCGTVQDLQKFFQSIDCGCGAENIFGLENIPICTNCFEEMQNSWDKIPRLVECDEYGSDSKYPYCLQNIHTNTMYCKTFDLCTRCASKSWLTTNIILKTHPEENLRRYELYLEDAGVSFGFEKEIVCRCGVVEQKHDKTINVCVSHYNQLYMRQVFPLTLIDYIQKFNASSENKFYLPPEIWDIIRKYIVLMN